MIKSENGLLLVNIPVDLEEGPDIGTYVARAQKRLDIAVSSNQLALQPGMYFSWSGQYQFMQEANKRLQVIVPVTLAVIFLLIYFNIRNITETIITIITLPFALIGGVWYLHFLDYNLSVAVVIGFIALAGLAAETGIIMHVYLDQAHKKHFREEKDGTGKDDLNKAIIEGAVLRVRPKMMTVITTILGLIPIMWTAGAGAGPMKRMAAPMIGGLITSTIHTLVLIPIYYAIYKYKEWKIRKESIKN